ncbi:MAG: 3-keto-5-aminohexanoate cleavage protein [Deltaproteobacteria bacterium]|nr:3-keto-5-aminohexanoate cleavage protein [Deltaproteobacteria bacterium]
MKYSLISTGTEKDKVIITAAITGGIHGKETNPNIPITPEEQAQAALECYNAGAAVLHLHVRGADGQNTPDIKVYNKAVRLIGEKCPIIRQIGNGIGAWMNPDGSIQVASLQHRLNLLNIRPQAEMHTINAGTFEFRTPLGGSTFSNPMAFNEDYITGCNEQGLGLEIEVYDLSHIANIMELVEKGLLKPPLHFSIVLGIKGGAPASPQNLVHMVDQIPEDSTWQVVTVSKYNLRSTLIAMAMGGNVRTGMEDTVSYQRGEPVKSNAQLVERMVRIAREMGREPATVEEAGRILGLNP